MGAPPTLSTTSRRLEATVRRFLSGRRVVLAVSGGRDSMALLQAAARAVRGSVAVVATFDHGTGRAASAAAGLVAREGTRLGFPVVVGHASSVGHSEAAWREARLSFLSDVAARTGGALVTAHTRDDQVETVLMRVLRDAGARGLAALAADARALRPFLQFSRDDVARYATSLGVRWIHDPTNDSTRFLRNRLRRDLLPALTRADPALPDALLKMATRAAAWRRRMDAWAAEAVAMSNGHLRVPVGRLQGRSTSELAVIWPALAAMVGLTMDWRGTERAAAFTTRSRPGARIPLAGGWEITRSREAFELGRGVAEDVPIEQPLRPDTRWLGWRFMAEDPSHGSTAKAKAASNEWVALLPENAALSVRRWRAGDRMRLGPGGARKVKRFLSDAHVTGARRGLWPVVLAGDEIVWIPGVRRSDAAAVRPGRSGVLYRCVPDDL